MGSQLPVAMAVVGTRPEAIKLAPISLAAQGGDAPVRIELLATGQHGTVVDEALVACGVRADVRLDITRADGTLSELFALLVASLGERIRRTAPAAVVVQGDTASAVAGALAAFYERVPVVHVEAGLQTGSIDLPFPEEAHRRMISTVARLHLAPTEGAADNLLRRRIDPAQVLITGNTVIDSLLSAVEQRVPLADDIRSLRANHQRLIVVTAHRRESWGVPLTKIVAALHVLAQSDPDLAIVVVRPPNPQVARSMTDLVGQSTQIQCVDPLPYLPFVSLLVQADVVLTDSGGLQEELPSLGVPIVVLRAETERPEGVDLGLATLAGTEPSAIVDATVTALRGGRRPSGQPSPYGDGRAGRRCLDAIGWMLGQCDRPDHFRMDDAPSR